MLDQYLSNHGCRIYLQLISLLGVTKNMVNATPADSDMELVARVSFAIGNAQIITSIFHYVRLFNEVVRYALQQMIGILNAYCNNAQMFLKIKYFLTQQLCLLFIIYRPNFGLLNDVCTHTFLCEIFFFFCYFLPPHQI